MSNMRTKGNRPCSDGAVRTPFELLEDYNRDTRIIENMMFTCKKCGINMADMELKDMIEHKINCNAKTPANEY